MIGRKCELLVDCCKSLMSRREQTCIQDLLPQNQNQNMKFKLKTRIPRPRPTLYKLSIMTSRVLV